MSGMDVRPAGPDDLPAVAATLSAAFDADPAWTWVFRDPDRRLDQLQAVWMLLLEAAAGYGWVWMTPGAGAVTQWIPPGLPELSPVDEARMEDLLAELLGPDVGRSEVLMAGFGANHPAGPDHYYLSLFGTRPDRRGHGLGMALLADNLARIDADEAPAYLESTNPANLDRYRSVGFVDHGSFTLPLGGPVVTTVWREPRA